MCGHTGAIPKFYRKYIIYWGDNVFNGKMRSQFNSIIIFGYYSFVLIEFEKVYLQIKIIIRNRLENVMQKPSKKYIKFSKLITTFLDFSLW